MFSALTENGKKCQVPFKYHKNGPKYDKCTPVGTTKGPWCATSVDEKLVYKTWEWCSREEGRILFSNLLLEMIILSRFENI